MMEVPKQVHVPLLQVVHSSGHRYTISNEAALQAPTTGWLKVTDTTGRTVLVLARPKTFYGVELEALPKLFHAAFDVLSEVLRLSGGLPCCKGSRVKNVSEFKKGIAGCGLRPTTRNPERRKYGPCCYSDFTKMKFQDKTLIKWPDHDRRHRGYSNFLSLIDLFKRRFIAMCPSDGQQLLRIVSDMRQKVGGSANLPDSFIWPSWWIEHTGRTSSVSEDRAHVDHDFALSFVVFYARLSADHGAIPLVTKLVHIAKEVSTGDAGYKVRLGLTVSNGEPYLLDTGHWTHKVNKVEAKGSGITTINAVGYFRAALKNDIEKLSNCLHPDVQMIATHHSNKFAKYG